jgi:hypothetical protein
MMFAKRLILRWRLRIGFMSRSIQCGLHQSVPHLWVTSRGGLGPLSPSKQIRRGVRKRLRNDDGKRIRVECVR